MKNNDDGEAVHDGNRSQYRPISFVAFPVRDMNLPILLVWTLCLCTTGTLGSKPSSASAFSLDNSARSTSSSSSSIRLSPDDGTNTNKEATEGTDESLPWRSPEIEIALQAVRKACRVTTKLQSQLSEIVTVTKQDASPVTVADFASQAIILQHLKKNFPSNCAFLAEESSDSLTESVTRLILQAIQTAAADDDDDVILEEGRLKECIDLGKTFFQTSKNVDEDKNDSQPRRVWCLDPIDGTKGFLRKGQYCVALALLEDGVPKIGILACPNLPFDDNDNNDSTVGCIFVASKGKGCYQLGLDDDRFQKKLEVIDGLERDASRARFCVGVEQGFADPVGKCKQMAKSLHGNLAEDGEILHAVRMDSQAKYGVIARGDAEFYVRLPKETHRDWIWDVAPGVVVLEEVGGIVTDAKGHPLDFSAGAKLTSNGVLGAINVELHRTLLESYRK